MFINNKDYDFRFRINRSLHGYKSKEQTKIALSTSKIREYNKGIENPKEQIMKMSFIEEEISIDEFVQLATSGYSFCHLFKYDPSRKYLFTWYNYKNYVYPEYKRGRNKGSMKIQMKSERFFFGSQCFFVDIDYSRFESVEDFIDKIPLKPTVTYLSFSDNEYKIDKTHKDDPRYDPCLGIKSRRFRLCYIFDQIILGKENFLRISKEIHRMVEDSTDEHIQDKCGMSLSQYFNGGSSKEVYVTGCIYNINDFSDTNEIIKESLSDVVETPLVVKNDIETEEINEIKQSISFYLIRDMSQLDYEEFMKLHRHKFKYYYRKDDRQWEDDYQIIDDEYFALFYNVSQLKDGDKRRKKLFQRMCLRRVMFPEITPDEVLYCAYVDLNRFIDNSEDPISVDCLAKNVKNAFSLSIDSIKDMYSQNIKMLKEKAPKHKMIYKLKGCNTPSERNRRKAEIRYKYYDKVYDNSLSIRENAEKIGVCKKTIQRYRKSRGYEEVYNFSNEELKQIIDPSISVRQNIYNIKEAYDIHVSLERMCYVLRELKEEMAETNPLKKNNDGCQYYIINSSSAAFSVSTERKYYNNAIDSSIDSSISLWTNYCNI